MTADRDDLAAILAKHRWIDKPFFWTGCSCDRLWWKGYESAGKTEDMYFAHVAQMVLESDWLRDVKADAWDEGNRAKGMPTMTIYPLRRPRNPYHAGQEGDHAH